VISGKAVVQPRRLGIPKDLIWVAVNRQNDDGLDANMQIQTAVAAALETLCV
jgi:hypothetical protein